MLLTLVQDTTATRTPHPNYLAQVRRSALLSIAIGGEMGRDFLSVLADMSAEIGEDVVNEVARLTAKGMTPRRARAEIDGVHLTLVGQS